MKVWYRNQIGDARACRISILDHGLLYGDGVFEGIRITGGKVFRLGDHLARFERSARAIGLELPLRGDALAAAVLATARAHSEAEAYVRLVATRGVGELGVDPTSCVEPELFCIVASLRMFPADVRAKGLRLADLMAATTEQRYARPAGQAPQLSEQCAGQTRRALEGL